MKANAPDKIYIQPDAQDGWFMVNNLNNTLVEYIRTDVFIEKVIGWIDYNNRNGGCNFDEWEEDFKHYIKGD